ncbi:NAD(P)/FAD-dependent oxidoreductase [Nocardioidaceae bacterium SCSIO 66511]|nr:NAD(P)/FAD-dependent oxidoreductase [Nocardioidaceae bacterium SCSIO 66511]
MADSPGRYDMLIIGAGPAGLYGAYYAGFRGFSVAVLDSLPEPGGQVSALYPEKLIYDVAGLPAIKGQDLVDDLVKQAASADPAYLLGHRAEELSVKDDHVEVTTHRGHVVEARTVLITGGIGTFTPRPLPDAESFEKHGLMYFVPNLSELDDLDVLIVGGGDSAFDWALSLEPTARSVTLIHRRERFRAHQGTVDKVRASSVRMLVPYEVARLHGGDRIEAAEIFCNADDGVRERLEVQAVVAALGFKADLGPFTRWGLEQRKRHIVTDQAMRTNLPRVFAAGDIVEYDGKVKLIAVGFGEAATAVNNAAVVIDPDAHVFPGHSSDP